jgi:beta-lactamase regulating signal transducer with metallopeptidase domain
MGIGVSLFLIAAGAVLKFAVSGTVSGLDISVVGVILMIVGAVGLVLSLILLASARTRRTTIVQQPVVGTPVIRSDTTTY